MKKIQNKQICSVRRPAYTTWAFTLVELIVVITILAILGTIAFISLQGYSSQARDSKRLSDIQNIKKSLELFSLNTGKYPEPDSLVTISYGGQDLRYQGTIGEQVAVNLSRNLNEKPTDPLTENEYTYSRTYAGNEYELLSIYESDLISLTSPQPSPTGEGARTSIFSSIFAANSNYPKINGNYNGVYVKAGTYYIPTPSIINANVWGNVDLAVTSDFLESQIITGGANNIANSGFEAITSGLTGMSVEIFTGELDTDIGEDDYNNKEELAQALIEAYSGTILANVGVYKEIVETASKDLVSLIDTFVLNKDNFVNTTSGGDIVAPLIGWRAIDSNCDIEDLSFDFDGNGTLDQVWAGCNSTLGDGFEWGQIDDDIGTDNYSGELGTCYDYNGNDSISGTGILYCNIGSTEMESSAKANTWFSGNNTNGDSEYANIWGKYYTWSNSPSACPTGRHVPSDSEWEALETHLNGGINCRNSTNLWLCDGLGWNSASGTKSRSLANALKLPLAGSRSTDGSTFGYRGNYTHLWSSTPSSTSAYYRYLGWYNSSVYRNINSQDNGFSVRCIKD